tara:strand:- start:441 stop:821 length:381 start_codon:yes stop_codon:yes gene_type:complete
MASITVAAPLKYEAVDSRQSVTGSTELTAAENPFAIQSTIRLHYIAFTKPGASDLTVTLTLPSGEEQPLVALDGTETDSSGNPITKGIDLEEKNIVIPAGSTIEPDTTASESGDKSVTLVYSRYDG